LTWITFSPTETTTTATTTTTSTTTTTDSPGEDDEDEEANLAEQAGQVATDIIEEVATGAQNIFSLLEDVLENVGEAFAEVY